MIRRSHSIGVARGYELLKIIAAKARKNAQAHKKSLIVFIACALTIIGVHAPVCKKRRKKTEKGER